MSRTPLTLSIIASMSGGAALAEVPQVAVDIAPVHSLVARVMEGIGSPDLIVQPGGSPHEFALRPSQAAALQNADVVFWVSPDLTPWMSNALETLSSDAAVTELLETEGTIELEVRETALFEAHVDDDDHDDDDHDDHDDDHDGDDHDGGDHDEDHEGDDHDGDHDEHGHGAHDTHAWLSPENAITWTRVIADQLSAADPENAGAYGSNADAATAEMETLIEEINATLDPVRGNSFIVFHDAYQYFEVAFDFPASGAISLSDASDPSPARIAEIQARIAEEGISCVLAEPQFNPGLVATVLAGTEAATGVLDPLGSDLEPGPALYPQLLRNLAGALAGCL